jgi:hypothetical protein
MYVPTDEEVRAALSVVGSALRIGGGQMPALKYPAVREAFRILNLHSEDGVWYETHQTWTGLDSVIDLDNWFIRDEAAFSKLRKPPKNKAPNYEPKRISDR